MRAYINSLAGLALAVAVAIPPALAETLESLTVHKSPTCGCCGKWIDHMETNGFAVNPVNSNDLGRIKREYGILPAYRSCHTAVSARSGYIFEGHVPAKIVARFLADPPEDARGLSVPAMPVGSPGMEVGDKFMPYEVLLLEKDGGTRVYTRIDTAEAQY